MQLPKGSYQSPKTKIICTIGPSSWDKVILRQMYELGMTGARINASFADFEELKKVKDTINGISSEIAVILDTQGHKIRFNKFKGPIELSEGSTVEIGCKKDSANLWVDCPSVLKPIKVGNRVLIDNGLFELEVISVEGDVLNCRVICGGILTSSKTVNFPGVHIDFLPLTEKDIRDIEFAVENGFDYISASFIRNIKDVEAIKNYTMGSKTRIIAKIENDEGMRNLDEIMEEVDGIMIARGDLGIESNLEKVPIYQKEIVKKCKDRGKIVIVATQMMESMRKNPIPTRAEISDVTNAVFEGTDCVMLSGETSTGKYPVETVKWMAKACVEAEKHTQPQIMFGKTDSSLATDSIARSVIDITCDLPIDNIVIGSKTGNSVFSISRHRPIPEMIVFVNDEMLARQLNLVYGARPVYVKEKFPTDRDWIVRTLSEYGVKTGLLRKESMVTLVTGSGIAGKSRNTIIEVAKVFDICKV